MEHEMITTALNIIGYQEEGEWVALVLEMDLRGYGDTFVAAVEDVAELVKMQIGFSRFKGQPELIWKPADPVWFELFAQVRWAHLESLVREAGTVGPDYSVAGLPIPPPHVIEAMKSGFALTDA